MHGPALLTRLSLGIEAAGIGLQEKADFSRNSDHPDKMLNRSLRRGRLASCFVLGRGRIDSIHNLLTRGVFKKLRHPVKAPHEHSD